MVRRAVIDVPLQKTIEASEVVPFIAPINGLNTREGRGAVAPNEARELINWYPEGNNLRLRLPNGSFATLTSATTNPVKTLFCWEGTTGEQLIAVNEGNVYNVTAGGATAKLHAGGWTEDEWITQNYLDKTIAVNGTDTPWRYDGSAVSATGITGSGLTLSNLNYVTLSRNRLWFCEENSLDAWYLGVGAVQGALTKFQLSQIARGGTLLAVGSWSQDMGDGPDDFTVFITSLGECIVYQGDPGGTFSLVGSYQAAQPVNNRCIFKIGGELILISRQGAYPMRAIFQGLPEDAELVPTWGKSAAGIKRDAREYGSNLPWFGFYHQGDAYISYPISIGSKHRQYVLNTEVGRWTQFDHTAYAMANCGGVLYYGAPSGVVQRISSLETGNDGSNIIATARPGFSYPGAPNIYKRVLATRPNIVADGQVDGRIVVDEDFETNPFSSVLYQFVTNENVGDDWDGGDDWDVAEWGIEARRKGDWFLTQGRGVALAIAVEVQTTAANCEWDMTHSMMKPGGPL